MVGGLLISTYYVTIAQLVFYDTSFHSNDCVSVVLKQHPFVGIFDYYLFILLIVISFLFIL